MVNAEAITFSVVPISVKKTLLTIKKITGHVTQSVSVVLNSAKTNARLSISPVDQEFAKKILCITKETTGLVKMIAS